MIEYQISENLTFDSVQRIYQDVFKWIKHHHEDNMQLDCQNVAFTDSAGVAMLVELQRVTKSLYKKQLVMCVSQSIAEMISFYDVEKIIG
ncbi:MAG: STAS domain-containing protein [Gammaproteobacteria bacterium]|nr:STAS domain-containing protein [Gammaproteobacteria bacterium]